jgi:hypothetical protein
MQRLIADAAKLSDTVDAQDMSFANIVEAIHVVQTEMGITGTTALEAGRTISGSVGAMKSAWTNLITGLADGNADIGKLIDNLVTTIVGDGTESNLGVIGNILPAIERALGGAVKLIEGAAPKIIEILPGLIERIIPSLLSSTTSLVNSLVSVLPKLLNVIVGEIVKNAPSMVIAAISLIKELAKGIFDNVGIVLDAAIELILDLANQLTDKEQLEKMLDSAARIVEEVSYGLIDAIPQLVSSAVKIVEKLISFILDPKNLAKILKMAFDIVVGIGTGLINAIPELLKSATRIISGIIALFKDADWGKIGSDLVAGFKNGISRAWSSLKTWFRNLFGDLIGIAKRILGIASPSKVFKKLGSFTADGFGIGFDDEFAHVKDDMEDALNFDDASVGINASIQKVGAGAAGMAYGGTSIGNITINIDGAKYSDEQSLASAIALEIQNMTDRRAAVYA